LNISMQTIRDAIAARLAPLAARVAGLVTRGELKTLKDSTGLQRAQVSLTADELQDDLEVITPPGFTSRPAAGAEVLVFAVGGNPAHRIAFVFDRGTRLAGELAEGEAAMYVGTPGQVVHLKANGDVVITPSAGQNVFLGDDGATKKVALADEVDDRFTTIKNLYNSHTHTGVTAGPGSTGTTPAVIGALAPTNSDNVYAKG
jgi:phage gp45-like